MNEVLTDLKTALNSIDPFYYEMPEVSISSKGMHVDEDSVKNYERRFVAQLKSEYDKLIEGGSTGDYQQVHTDLEVIKRYIYSETKDNAIVSSYNRLRDIDHDRAFNVIKTIPDLFIHNKQDNRDEIHQKLVVEAKTTREVNEEALFFDLFKLNVYVEKFNFQNGVLVVLHNDPGTIKKVAKKYLRKRFYLAPKNREKIYLFIKPDADSDLEMIRLVDI